MVEETEVRRSLTNSTEDTTGIQEFTMATQHGRTQWKQWLASISATLSMVVAGTVYGWSTISISRLLYDLDAPVRITNDESSWLVALTVVGSMIGPFLGAWLSDRIGRKKTLLISSLYYIIGWIIIIFAKEISALYTARIILGIGIGMSYTTNPMYVSEVADVNIRGALGTLIAVNVFTGSLFACSIGPWMSVQLLTIILLIIPIVFLATFIWFPESPYYLVSKGRYDEAARTIAYFKGIEDKEEIKEELDLVINNVSENVDRQKWTDKIVQLNLPNNRKALCIVIGLIIAQQFSGSFSTMQYLEVFFREANISIDSNIATIIVLAVGLISGALSTMTVEKAGRRSLLIVSSMGACVTLLILGIYLFLNAHNIDVSTFNWLPVVDVILFQIAYQIGLGTLLNALIGELFPTNVKGIAGAIVTISDGLFSFAVSKLYQVIGDALGKHVIYFFFAGSCLVAFLLILAFVPETKGKTFNEIQEELKDNSIRCIKRRDKV